MDSATEVGMSEGGGQTTQPMQPNFVLMKLPGETGMEFVEILPFTPANRNNLIGWIGGRSDGDHYGTAVVYNFPKNKLVDGPLQIEARIDQNAQLSGQLTLWNQQGSHVRRGTLLVIPTGRALLYAEPIYLQAERSPMPELRLVVLALQDRLAYGSTFESALAALFGGAGSSLTAAEPQRPAQPSTASASQPTADLNPTIAEAAKDLADYQRYGRRQIRRGRTEAGAIKASHRQIKHAPAIESGSPLTPILPDLKICWFRTRFLMFSLQIGVNDMDPVK